MEELLKKFEDKKPEIVFEWKDEKTDAEGWIVINSLRGGAAAGGTRMRIGVTKDEVLALAKTMEVKFTVAGPPIGGGKSGINFNPKDPRKREVLKRWYAAAKPLLKTYYGTGGDMNVDEVHEVMPMCEEQGILFPLEGIVNGHHRRDEQGKMKIINQLKVGVPLIVRDENLTPNSNKDYSVGDLITGYGVSETILHYYTIYGGEIKGKRVIIQGWGNVAGAAAYYLAQAGAIIVGIIDKAGGVVKSEGYSFEEIKSLLENRSSNFLEAEGILSFEQANEKIWNVGAEIFVPAAASRLLTQAQLDTMIDNKLEVISSGANVPFADKEIFFGPISKSADERVSVLPDFIANCGMARVFAYLMEDNIEMTDKAIFADTSDCIKNALITSHTINNSKTHISKTAFEIALKQLV
ncbi:MAG: Glu/Leu/Phe/Val dehydrogenase [Flavobacteriales bacterium]|jgi:glutamate dehydrogenase/leucine dehydrogenase|nr:Glu/Leu/Phe/Val dehydrogenase [Flavobacteriales bacterium]MBT5090018.1 Glu/Leu/Phe/Val dehydrogenase [Flavobacteriales bacterium]MBT5750160.1 Glu/Leu/Phe/Val dehydrogenase [Flavobacteriales bacterium]